MKAESAHFFSGETKDLKTYEDVDADEFFLRRELKQVLGASAPLYNLHFLVMQAQPFAPGQRFEVAYSKKDSDKRKTFVLSFDGEKRQSYRFEYDDPEIPVKLVRIPTRVKSAGKKNAALAPFAAYAQTIPALIPTVVMSAHVAQRVVEGPPSVDLRLVNLLQEARTGVGAKIDALDRLLRMDATALKPYSDTITDREPFALTLIELSRHSDKELATKARMIAEKSGAESALARQLGSPRPEVRAAAELAVSRASGERADRILKMGPQSARTQKLMAQVHSGENQQILTPVGSERGDRYYVKANWDPKDRKTASCLAQLFNRELISSRSVQDEQKLMAGKSERLVYWYTKEWALMMAERIKGCGGKASFPQPRR